MTDQERDLPSKDDARVRQLLADARVDSPTPPEVVRRLDGVLHGLEGVPGESAEPVVDHLTRRRRRNVSRLLLAAAAVVVAGIGINAIVDEPEPDAAPTTALEASADAGATDSQDVPDRTRATDPLGDLEAPLAAAPEASADQDTQRTTKSASYAIALGGGGLNQAVQRVMRAARGAAVSESGYLDLADAELGPGLSLVGDFVCTPAAWGRGRLIPIYYGGTPNVLALRTPIGKTQVVDVLQCGTGDIVRSLSFATGR
ncbi:hypothetical protein GCM10027020_30690 [Nocardioides salsibiostraticola]